VYTVLPSEALAWAREQGIAQPPPVQSAAAASPETVALAPAQGGPALWMSGPDEGARYEIDAGLPRAAQKIEISVRAEPSGGWGEVTLVADGQPLAQFAAAPYKVLWQLEPGSHEFWAEGKTIRGASIRSNRVVIEVLE
jgi:hypothetical protein